MRPVPDSSATKGQKLSSALKDPVDDAMPGPDAMLQAYLDSARRILAIVSEVGEERASTPVPATPAWDVRDLFSHVTSIAMHTALSVPWGDDVQATIDADVAERRERTLTETSEEWRGYLATIEEKFKGRGPGPLVVDVVTHEHDLRAALGPKYEDHTAGLTEVLPAIVKWIRSLDLVSGPGIEFESPTYRAKFGGPDVSANVAVPSDWELFRLLAVRRSKEQLENYEQSGDRTLLFTVTSRYPLPASPLEAD